MPDANSAGIADAAEIYFAPTDVFERRRDGAFWLPYIIFVVVFAALFLATKGLLQPLYDAEASKQMAKAMAQNPEFTAEQAAKGRQMAGTFQAVGALFFGLIMPFIVGIVSWLAAKLVTGAVGLKQGMMIGTFALFPVLLEQIINAAQAATIVSAETLTTRYALSIGPARFLDPNGSPLAAALLGHIDPFTIWSAFLIGLGVKVIGGTTNGQAATVGVVVWILGVLPAILGSLAA